LKRRELERHLTAHGCDVLREGLTHTIWRNQLADLRAPVPRHREIPTATARAICANSRSLRQREHAEQASGLA
jgi:hypothetical protein